jgi:hypothetical protein
MVVVQDASCLNPLQEVPTGTLRRNIYINVAMLAEKGHSHLNEAGN